MPAYGPWYEIANSIGSTVPMTTTLTPMATEVPSTGSEVTSTVRKYFPETWIWDCNTVRCVASSF